MKKIVSLCIILLTCLVFSSCLSATNTSGVPTRYGVFIGMEPKDMEKLYTYEEVVIDAAYFTKTDIETLHQNGVTVYSYINLGSIENFRDYYDDFVSLTLSDYENWPEERWIDVSNPKWQNFFIHTMAKELVEKGIDGLFIDNVDIYYLYHTEAMYNGIKETLLGLKKTYDNIPIIINGGYEFIETSLENELDLTTLIDGINQESVFAAIDFENNCLTKNTLEERMQLLDYFERVHEKGVAIYIIEYTKSNALIKELQSYYAKTDYAYYVSSNIELQ
nr:endo alpha-1,4 polygalactosaminidase [uncultured Cellulosilyticum sp.]